MSRTKINYQQIYEEDLSGNLKESLEMPQRFFELSHQDRLLVEELVDIGYQQAIDDALDPEALGETAALCAEMGTQLYNFANVLHAYINPQILDDGNGDD